MGGGKRPGGKSSVGGVSPLRPAVTPILRFVKSETLYIAQRGFGLPTCLTHTVFKCLNYLSTF